MNNANRPDPAELMQGGSHRLVYLRRALKLIWQASRYWTIAWFTLVVAQGLLPAVIVYLTKVLVDGLAGSIGAGLSWEAVKPMLVPTMLMVAVLLLTQTMQGLTNWIRSVQAELVQDYIKSFIHRKAATADLELFEIPELYDSLARANGEASARSLSMLQNLGTLFQHATTMVAVAILLVPYGAWLPAALFISTLPALWVVVRHNKFHHDWWRETTEQQRWATYFDNVMTLPLSSAEVRLFGLADHFREAYGELRQQLREGKLRLLRKQTLAQAGAGLIALTVTAVVLVWMIAQTLQGRATLGDVALFYQAFNQGQGLMRSLLSSVGQLYADTLFLEHLFTFLDIEPRITDPEQPTTAPLSLKKGIAFRNVSFRYPGSRDFALRGLSMTIPAGRTVAVVGPNGAGKTTITKLLCRFHEPSSGSITIDGVDVRSFRVEDLRRLYGVLFQTPVHFRATAGENISIGDILSMPDQDRVEAAALASGANEVIRVLPDGYDTLLGKEFMGGVQLSWGQWQRVALARAFYRSAPVIILDEPTSAMDSWAEGVWLDRLKSLVTGKTAVIITHRFTTAMRADIIFVMNDGKIVEEGSHYELLALDGLYAASWKAQIRDESHSGPSRTLASIG